MKAAFYAGYMRWRLQGFGRVMFWGDKLEQRFSTAGRWLLMVLLVTLVFGSDTKQSMLYQMVALLLVWLAVALLLNILLSIGKAKALQVSRRLPAVATVNTAFTYHIALQNQSQNDIYDVRVGERFATYIPNVEQFFAAHEPLEDQRNWYDRKTGFYKFVWLQERFRGADFKPQIVRQILAGQKFSLEVDVLPVRRGWLHFSHLRTALPEPLGVFYRFEEYEKKESVLVLPKRYAVGQHLSLAGGIKHEQGGVSQASVVGDSEEFSCLREYRSGDSPRHIDWASLARGGKLLVKEYQDEHFTRQTLVLDSFADAAHFEAFEEAISLAAGFAATVETDDSLLDVLFMRENNSAEPNVEQLTLGRAMAHTEQMLQALAMLDLTTKDDFQQLGKAVLRQTDAFSACVVILLAWDEPRQYFIRKMLALGMVLRVFLVIEADNRQEFIPVAGLEDKFHVLQAGQVQQGLDSIDVT